MLPISRRLQSIVLLRLLRYAPASCGFRFFFAADVSVSTGHGAVRTTSSVTSISAPSLWPVGIEVTEGTCTNPPLFLESEATRQPDKPEDSIDYIWRLPPSPHVGSTSVSRRSPKKARLALACLT